jgi:energy-coupling factor transporter ATP-binding protein EcfA2
MAEGVALAYPFSADMKAWADRAVPGLASVGQPAYAPHQHFNADYVICSVCREIRARPIHLSEITEPNWNVYYEAGYAFGADKLLLLAEDGNADVSRSRTLFPEYFRLSYYYEADVFHKVAEAVERRHLTMSTITATLDPSRLYFIDPGIKSEPIRELKHVLSRFKRLRYSESQGGMVMSPGTMQAEAYEIAASGAVVGLLLPRNYVDQDLINARSCFLIGIAVALEKPTLLLVPDQAVSGPADLQLLTKRFTTFDTLTSVTRSWLQSVIEQDRVALHRDTVSVLDIDLGNAWAERDPDLGQYFLETTSYRRAKNGATTLLLGRRGSGKSAIALTLAREAQREGGLAERTVRPEAFEMQELEDAYRAVTSDGSDRHWKLVLGAIWRYLLLTQLAWTYLKYFERYHEQPEERPALEKIIGIVPHEDDFVRAVLAVTEYVGQCSPAELRRFMGMVTSRDLTDPIVRLCLHTPARLVLDNLDATWDTYYEDSRFVLSQLIRQAEWLNQRFDQRATIMLCLRSDIYNIVKLADPDVDKQTREELRWEQDTLVEVVGLRLQHLLELEEAPTDAWTRVFPATVGGQEAASYLIERTMRRPRELIKLCSFAIERAQTRAAKKVSEEDVVTAAVQFSDVLLTELHGEFLIELPDLYYFVLEFSQLEWPLGLDEARGLIRRASEQEARSGREHSWHSPDDPDATIRRLYDVGVFGTAAWKGRELAQRYSYDRPWASASAEMRTRASIRRENRPDQMRTLEPLIVLHPGLIPVLGGTMTTRRPKYVERRRP